MKYIIWGAGRRGKWTIQFLEEKNVLAFIDGNHERIGEEFCGKTIISFEEAQKKYNDYLIVLTPLEGSDEIACYLESRSFYCFLKLEDLPMDIPCDEIDKCSVNLSYDKRLEYGFTEVDLLSIYLYQKMMEENTIVRIALQKDMHSTFVDLLRKHICFSSKEEVLEKSDIVIGTGQEKNDILSKTISEESFVMEYMLPSRMNLVKYKDIHQGKRCFIVATGPSLRVEDLDKIHENGDICISMNRIFNIFNRTKWRPDYYMICDTEMIEDLSEEIANLDLKYKFVTTEPKCYWSNPKAQSSIPYNLIFRVYTNKSPIFSTSFEKGLGHGTTVTYLCIQLAVYMGFSEIYLLGVDFNYTNNVYDSCNHFEGCDTIKNKIRLNTIYPDRIMLAYEKAKKYCVEHDIKICNATRGGKLEVYDRVEFDDLF